MKKNYKWFSAILIVLLSVLLIDAGTKWWSHPEKTPDEFRFIVASLLLLLLAAVSLLIYFKNNKNRKE